METKQKLMVILFVVLIVITIGLVGFKIYSEISKNKDMINGNYYTTTKLVDAEFLGKYSYDSRGINHRKGITHDEFKLIESGEIVKIQCGVNTGHTGEKYVTLAIIDYYSKDTDKFLYQKIEVREIKENFESNISEENIESQNK